MVIMKVAVFCEVKLTDRQAGFHINVRSFDLRIAAQFTVTMSNGQSEEISAVVGFVVLFMAEVGARKKTWQATAKAKPGADKDLEARGLKKTMKDLCRLRGSCWVTAIALPATPVFGETLSESEDCVFPHMRFEDLRLASFFTLGGVLRVPLSPAILARAGYYYDVIYSEIRCFGCGCSYHDGHCPVCTDDTRKARDVPLNQCGVHRQQVMQENSELHMITSAPGFHLRDHNENRGAARQQQHQPRFRLQPVLCPECRNIPANEVVYSCGHRHRSCETCSPLQELCPCCGQGSSNNPTMAEYRSRTTVLTHSDAERCRTCRHNRANVVLLPCRHLAVCAPCSHQLASCPRCAAAITGIVPVLE